MNRYLPRLAVLLGVAGLIPFIGCGLGAITAGDGRGAELYQALMFYAALILSFLGGVHWGFALDAATPLPEAAPGAQRARLLLGVLPSLVGWLGLLLTLVVPPAVGLAVLIAGYIATTAVEAQGRRRGLVPPGYMVLRWVLSVVVIAVLVTVLVVRLIGAHVAF